jgi:hypothetical protein
MEDSSKQSPADEKRLLAFVVSEEHDVLYVHVDKEGIDILMRSLERLKNDLEEGECEHEHLMSEEWGGWELSVSDQAGNGKGKPVHQVNIYGWTDQWAERNGFDRSLS